MTQRQPSPFQWPLSIDAVWLLMPLFVVTVRTLLQPIPPQDYWWHLALGRLIARTGEIPATNLYLYSIPVDAPFFDQPWLAQWLMFQAVELFGHIGTIGVHLALILGAWGLLIIAASRRGTSPMVVGIGASLAHFIAATTLSPRTQMFAYPCFVILVAALLIQADRRAMGRGVFLVLLGVTTAFWANVHGTFVLAPVLTGATAAGLWSERRRRGVSPDRGELVDWAAAVVVTAVAVCVTPHGVENLVYPFHILGATHGEGPAVLEWLPPGLYLQGIVFYAALLGSVAVLALRRAEVRVYEVLLLFVTAAIAVSSVRGVLWWGLCAVLIIGPHLTALVRAPDRATSTAQGVLNAAFIVAFVAVSVACWPGGPLFRQVQPEALFGEGRQADAGPLSVLSSNSPVGLLEPLRTFEGRVFAEQSAAGYLEYHLSGVPPAPVVFVDQRLEMLPPKLWEDYFTITGTRAGWHDVLDSYAIEGLLVHEVEQPILYEAVQQSSKFREVGRDRMWSLWARVP